MDNDWFFMYRHLMSVSNIIIGLLVIGTYIAQWRVFEKAGKPGWASLVPIYNYVVMFEIAGIPAYNIVFFFIPVANIFVVIYMSIGIAKRFGKSNAFGVGIALLPFVYFPILAFEDNAIFKRYYSKWWVKSIGVGVVLLLPVMMFYSFFNLGKPLVRSQIVEKSFAMYDAVEKDDADYVKLHLHDGRDWVTHSDEHASGVGTLLHFAASCGSPRVTTALLEAGASPMRRDDTGHTALGSAIELGRHDIVEIILARNDVDVNLPDGETSPLHIAAKVGDVETTRLLLQKGARVNAKDEHKDTPLRLAMDHNFTEEMQVLRESGGEEKQR